MCSASEGFYFQASNGSVALPVAGYNYNSDWTPLLAGLAPAGMAASLAAPDPYGPNSGIRLPPWVCDGKAFFVPVLPYALQRMGHAYPALSPARALLARIPLGLHPWLHRLR